MVSAEVDQIDLVVDLETSASTPVNRPFSVPHSDGMKFAGDFIRPSKAQRPDEVNAESALQLRYATYWKTLNPDDRERASAKGPPPRPLRWHRHETHNE
jgi:hypothetical protein